MKVRKVYRLSPWPSLALSPDTSSYEFVFGCSQSYEELHMRKPVNVLYLYLLPGLTRISTEANSRLTDLDLSDASLFCPESKTPKIVHAPPVNGACACSHENHLSSILYLLKYFAAILQCRFSPQLARCVHQLVALKLSWSVYAAGHCKFNSEHFDAHTTVAANGLKAKATDPASTRRNKKESRSSASIDFCDHLLQHMHTLQSLRYTRCNTLYWLQ